MHILLSSPTDLASTDILRLVKDRAPSKLFESFAHIRQSTEATFLGEGGLLLCDVRIDNRGDDTRSIWSISLMPNPNDEYRMKPEYDASFSRSVSGFSVRNLNSPALAGGCLIQERETVMSYTSDHLDEVVEIARRLDVATIESMADILADLKRAGGRVFFLGVGGSAANCSHAVNDFRKILAIESYAPSDNVSELTARANDEGWASIFVEWLKISKLNASDLIFVFSVGGGDLARNISPNLISALEYAKSIGSKVLAIVGRDGGFAAKVADVVVIIPTVNPNTITPHAEAFQAVIWHLLVSHPKLKGCMTKWESLTQP